jgi:hypothetical protein
MSNRSLDTPQDCPFKVGLFVKEYQGYRKLTDKEWTSPEWQRALIESYMEHDGWPLLEEALTLTGPLCITMDYSTKNEYYSSWILAGDAISNDRKVLHKGIFEHKPITGTYTAIDEDERPFNHSASDRWEVLVSLSPEDNKWEDKKMPFGKTAQCLRPTLFVKED